MAITRNLILFLISVVFSLFLAEGIVRVIAPQSVAVPWQDEIEGITAPKANARGRHAIPNTFDVTVSFNSQRFRGRKEFRPQPASGVLRIAVLGDSFTFGYGANDDETYPAELQRILQRQEDESQRKLRVEVINAGNGGTGTGEQALWFDSWVKRFSPHVVIITVVSNDMEDDLARRLFVLDENGTASPRSRTELTSADGFLRSVRRVANTLPAYSWLAQHSQLAGIFRNAVSSAIARNRSSRFAADADGLQQDGGDQNFQKRGLTMLGEEIAWLGKRVGEAAGRLVVVFVPSRETIYPAGATRQPQIRTRSEAIVEVLKNTCKEKEIPFLDVTSYMRERAKSLKIHLYYDGLDTHPNPEGYKAIAEAVAKFLKSAEVM